MVVPTDGSPHLVTTRSQVFSKGLDGAGLVVLYQLCQAPVRLTVSCYDELSILVLSDDKMATPVMTPCEEKKNQAEMNQKQRGSKEAA